MIVKNSLFERSKVSLRKGDWLKHCKYNFGMMQELILDLYYSFLALYFLFMLEGRKFFCEVIEWNMRILQLCRDAKWIWIVLVFTCVYVSVCICAHVLYRGELWWMCLTDSDMWKHTCEHECNAISHLVWGQRKEV